MPLKAKKPEAKEKRLKMSLYGAPGVGKTIAAIMFPNSYIIDTEKGTDFYAKMIAKQGSVVLQTFDPDEVYDELKALMTEKHDFRTLIIDPITMIYNATQDKWNRIFEKHTKSEKDKEIADFGMRYWGKVKGNFKSIQRLILALDMNVIITAHQKDIYGGNFNKIGVDMDSMKGDAYIFDYVFRIEKKADNKRIAINIKERALIGEQKFPEEFEWSYENFLTFYGKDIVERKAVPVAMATKDQVYRVNMLMGNLKVEDEQINKWFNKANVASFGEMTEVQIGGVVKYLEKKLKEMEKK